MAAAASDVNEGPRESPTNHRFRHWVAIGLLLSLPTLAAGSCLLYLGGPGPIDFARRRQSPGHGWVFYQPSRLHSAPWQEAACCLWSGA